MTATTSDGMALLAAIREQPEEDTPRLVFADYLDGLETASVPCPNCHGEDIGKWHGGSGRTRCGTCEGTGSVPDASDRARAELIRVQCELARLPPKPRELFVADGAGQRLEGLGVALIPHGGGHYSASSAERGLSIETFAPNERVDVYAHLARKDRVGWIRGLRYVKHVPDRHQIVFRKDAESGPWKGTGLKERERELLAAHADRWRRGPACEKCRGRGNALDGSEPDGTTRMSKCKACDGVGDAGGLLRPTRDDVIKARSGSVGCCNRHADQMSCDCLERAISVTYHRGMARVHCRAADWKTNWAESVVTHHPDVVEFELIDAPVWHSSMLDGWTAGAASSADVPLPANLFEAVTDRDNGWPYATEEQAKTMLRRLAVRLIYERIRTKGVSQASKKSGGNGCINTRAS